MSRSILRTHCRSIVVLTFIATLAGGLGVPVHAQRLEGPRILAPSALSPRANETAHQHQQPATEPGYLGLITDDRNEQGRGARVMKVVENSPAARAGIQEQDLITAIGQRRIRSLDDVVVTLSPLVVGSRMVFEVDRRGNQQSIEVTLGKRPPVAERQVPFGRLPARPPTSSNPESLPLNIDSAPRAPTATSDDALRIEQLERRVRDLEQRLQRLEQALQRAGK